MARPAEFLQLSRRRVLLALCALGGSAMPTGCAVVPMVGTIVVQQVTSLVVSQLEAALLRSLQTLATPGAIERDTRRHIPLPPRVRLVIELLRVSGLSQVADSVDDLEHLINQTVEQMAGQSYPLYQELIQTYPWMNEVAQALNGLGVPTAATGASAPATGSPSVGGAALSLPELLQSPGEAMRRLAMDTLRDRLYTLAQDQARANGLEGVWQVLVTAQTPLQLEPTPLQLDELPSFLADQLTQLTLREMDQDPVWREQIRPRIEQLIRGGSAVPSAADSVAAPASEAASAASAVE
jgi:hypothetical protein